MMMMMNWTTTTTTFNILWNRKFRPTLLLVAAAAAAAVTVTLTSSIHAASSETTINAHALFFHCGTSYETVRRTRRNCSLVRTQRDWRLDGTPLYSAAVVVLSAAHPDRSSWRPPDELRRMSTARRRDQSSRRTDGRTTTSDERKLQTTVYACLWASCDCNSLLLQLQNDACSIISRFQAAVPINTHYHHYHHHHHGISSAPITSRTQVHYSVIEVTETRRQKCVYHYLIFNYYFSRNLNGLQEFQQQQKQFFIIITIILQHIIGANVHTLPKAT